MLKYENFTVSFAEVPEEISLYITITNCPIHCNGCNSSHLWEDTGKVLNWSSLITLIHINSGITCVCFGGGDISPKDIDKLAWHVKRSTNLKTCWYSGAEEISKDVDLDNLDFIKVGPFKGIPLNKEGTNQRFYKVDHENGNKLINQTFKFQNNENKDLCKEI